MNVLPCFFFRVDDYRWVDRQLYKWRKSEKQAVRNGPFYYHRLPPFPPIPPVELPTEEYGEVSEEMVATVLPAEDSVASVIKPCQSVPVAVAPELIV